MGQICHAHCPPGGGGHVITAAVAAAGAALSGVVAVIGDVVAAAGIIMILLVAGGAWLLVHLLRRDRGLISGREDIAVLVTPRRAALPQVRQAINGTYVITDARAIPESARVAGNGDGATR